jgi:hypothetical protein
MADKLSKHVTAFQKRWNAKWDDKTAFLQFKNRLLFLIDKNLSRLLVPKRDLINQYAYLCGVSAPYSSGELDDMFSSIELKQHGLSKTIIFSSIENAQTPIHLAWQLQNLFLVLDEYSQANQTTIIQKSINSFVEELKDLLVVSPSAQMRLSKSKKGIIIFPAGAKLLDEGLVNDNLIWLQEYPESLKAFEQALAIYLSGDKPKYRNLVDNLRVALELLLRQILENTKSLENQKKDLNTWLESHKVHVQTKNLYSQLLFGPYSIFQNDAAKHGDEEILIEEIEYMLYLTGTFMRLLIQLRRSEA